jgi:beta-xylosidase
VPQTFQRAARATVLSLAMLAVTAVNVSARLADYPPLANTPDPGAMLFKNGFVVVGTSKVENGRVFPILYSADLRRWKTMGYVFGGTGSEIPRWIDQGQWLWAPEIESVGNSYVVHYSAFADGKDGRCIGRAKTTFPPDEPPNVLGGFIDRGRFLRCSDFTGSVSLIDPSLFQAPNGHAYLLYKIDYHDATDKQIAILKVNNDGMPAPRDTGTTILKATEPWELEGVAGGVGSVEAPTMIYRRGMYYLFYSGNDYRTDRYGVGVARSPSPTGPFMKNPANPILTGEHTPRFCGVGHQDIVYDTPRRRWLIFYHSYRGSQGGRCETDVGRFMKVQRLRWNRMGWPYVNRSSEPQGSNTPVAPEP